MIRLILLLLLVGCTAANAGSFRGPKNYNFLMVTVDDASKYAMQPFSVVESGYGALMPNLDAMAQGGVVFNNFIVTGQCVSTRASLMAGRWDTRTRADPVLGAVLQGSSDPVSEMPIARAVKEAHPGYRTGAFGKLGLNAALASDSAWQFGFDKGLITLNNFVADYTNWTQYETTGATVVEDGTSNTTYYTDATTDAFLDWVDDEPDVPFFAWVTYQAPHSPFHEPAAARTGTQQCVLPNTDEDCYKLMISDVDAELQVMLDDLEALGILDETIVCFFGDNGNPAGKAGGGKQTLTERGYNVGMVCAHGPVEGGRVVSDLFALVDMRNLALEATRRGTHRRNFPTVPGDVRYNGQAEARDGVSLWGALTNTGTGWGHDYAIVEARSLGSWVVRTPAYKYVLGISGAEALYLLPDESNSLCAAGDPQNCENLSAGAALTARNGARAYLSGVLSDEGETIPAIP